MAAKRDTYKFYFKIGNLIVHKGITNDLKRRETELKNSGKTTTHNGKRLSWKNGHIFQVGNAVTKDSAQAWEREVNTAKKK